jgi:hypothetical protein
MSTRDADATDATKQKGRLLSRPRKDILAYASVS